MRAKITNGMLVLCLSWSCGLAWAQGQTVYKSVDEDGNVTFSDTPPAEGNEVEQMQVQAPPPQSPGEQQQALEDMRETTDRMAADRREREKHRAEMKELNARTAAVAPTANEQPDYGYQDYYSTVPGYGVRSQYYNGPHRPGYRPKPAHPIVRPPLQHESGSNNSQLMRPMVSGKSRARPGGR